MATRSVSPRVRQVLVDLSIGMVMMGTIAACTMPLVILSQWRDPYSMIQFTIGQENWFGSMASFICIPGYIVGGFLCEQLGPRKMFLVVSPILSVALLAVPCTFWTISQNSVSSETLMMIFSVVQVAASAVLIPCGAVYIYEISDKYIRGTMTSMVQIFSSAGFLLCLGSGIIMSWKTVALVIPLLTIVPGSLGVFFSPESPLWMARKGKHTKAETIMKLVRYMPEEVTSDLQTAQANSAGEDTCCSNSLNKFKDKSNILGIAASCLIMMMHALGGRAFFSFMMWNGISKEQIVMVFIAFLGCHLLGTVMVHYLSRRLILTLGNIMIGLSTVTLGTYFYLQDDKEISSEIAWLPYAGYVIILVGYAVCVSPCSLTMGVEVLPEPVRAIGHGIAISWFCTLDITFVRLTPDLHETLGLWGLLWLYSVCSVCCIVTVFLLLPETKTLSLEGIINYWENAFKKKRNAAPA